MCNSMTVCAPPSAVLCDAVGADTARVLRTPACAALVGFYIHCSLQVAEAELSASTQGEEALVDKCFV